MGERRRRYYRWVGGLAAIYCVPMGWALLMRGQVPAWWALVLIGLGLVNCWLTVRET